MTVRTIAVCTIMAALSGPAVGSGAATYQWRDDKGVTHFTDNPDRIPLRFRTGVRELPSVREEAKPQPSAPPVTAQEVPPPIAGGDKRNWQEEFGRLRRELKEIQEALPGKKEELAKLHHQWIVKKGKTPSNKELAAYEKKQAKGKATAMDNPYVTTSPLSSPVSARQAYYKKLDEVRKDEEEVARLTTALQLLERDADRAGVPAELRN